MHPGRDWSKSIMAVTESIPAADMIIDLDDPPTGHRLVELVQALTGCSIERAELAVSDPIPVGPASPRHALDTMARALVALTSRAEAALPGSRRS